MMQQSIEAYLGLLEIRLRAGQRNTWVAGSAFMLGMASFFLLGMIGALQGLEVFVASAILIAFGFSFLSTLMRVEALKAVQEFARSLQQSERAA